MRRSLERAGGPQPAVRPQTAAGFDNFQSRGPVTRPRQRFVQDGEVPVTLVGRPRQGEPGPVSQSRLAASESALATERTARIKVERSLQAALTTLQDLQTKQRHAEFAQREALQAAIAERQVTEVRLAEADARLAEYTVLAAGLEAELAVLRATLPISATQAQSVPEIPPKPKPKRGPGKVRKPGTARTPREPKPVKWWLGQTTKARAPKLG